MRHQSRRAILKGIGVSSTVGLAGCIADDGGNGGDSDGLPETVKIGFIVPQSGDFSSFGTTQIPAMEMAISDFNDSDDILSDTTLEVVVSDNQSDSQVSLSETNRLISQENVDVIAGGGGSATAGAIVNTTAENDIPFFMSVPTSVEWTSGESCEMTTFRANTHSGQVVEACARFGAENLGDSTYLLVPDYNFGRNIVDVCEPVFNELGVEILNTTFVPLNTQDYSSYIEDIQSVDPDWLYEGLNTSVSPFLVQAGNRNLEYPMTGQYITPQMVGSLTPEQFDRLPPLYRGSLRHSIEIDNGTNNQFVSRFRERVGRNPFFPGAVAYQTIQLLAHALNESRSTDVEDIHNTIDELSWQAPMGETTMRSCDHQGIVSPMYSTQFTGVDTEEEWGEEEVVGKLDGEDLIMPCSQTHCNWDS